MGTEIPHYYFFLGRNNSVREEGASFSISERIEAAVGVFPLLGSGSEFHTDILIAFREEVMLSTP